MNCLAPGDVAYGQAFKLNDQFRVNGETNQTFSDLLQEDFQTISEFVRRTDALAARFGLNLSEIHGLLGISKAMVFAYRSGKNPITQKVWHKLAAAEAKADGDVSHLAESSADPKNPGIGESAYVRQDPAPYNCEVDPVSAAFAKIREGLDLLEQLMKNPKL